MSFINFINSRNSENTEYPDGVYVALEVQSQDLRQFQEIYLSDYELEDLHCTLIYSKKPFSGIVEIIDTEYEVEPLKFSLFGPENDVLVLEIQSEELRTRNRELVQKYGFISDWDFSPHITLAKNFTGSLESLDLLNFDITLGNEYVQDLDLGYS